MNHLDRILKLLEAEGRIPTPEELSLMAGIQEEIDRLYNIIMHNQAAFINPLYVAGSDKSEGSITVLGEISEEEAGMICYCMEKYEL